MISGVDKREVALALFGAGVVKFGQFKLKSGIMSPVYLDLRVLVSHPKAQEKVARVLANLLAELKFDRIAGIPYAALPIATLVSTFLDRPMIYPRKEVKEYGTKKAIEGEYKAGERIVVVDDLITTGGSKIETIKALEAEGLKVTDIAVVVDRAQGGAEQMSAAGYKLHSVITLPEILELLVKEKKITAQTAQEVRKFLAENH